MKYILLSCCFLLNLYSNNSLSYNLEKINFQEEKLETFAYETKENNLNLTQEQKEYLKDKKELKLCVDPNWLPLEKIENNEHIGITSDFFKLISQMIETPISLVETKEWTESLEKIKRRECDILSLAEKTPSREKYLNFTKPYFSAPLVIVTKVGVPFVDNLNSIKEKSLAIVKDYSMEELLKNKYPGINLIEVKSIYEGLAYVQQDKVSGFLDNSLVINYEIQKNNMKDIAITGQFEDTYYLSIASRNDEAILNEILEKALLSIDGNTKTNLINKWKNIKYQVETDYKLVLEILFFGISIIVLFIYWNLKLKDEIRNKEIIQKKLKQSEEKFRTLFDIAPILLDAFDDDGKVILWNKECEKVFGWSLEEIQKEKNPISLLYPDTLIQKEIFEDFQNNDGNIYKEWHPITKDGKEIITRWANIQLPNDEIIHVGYDITQQRKNEKIVQEKTEQLKIAKQQLEELNSSLENRIESEINKNTKQQMILMHQSKLAQMGEMIENIAHQWRQPLAQINSLVLLIDMELNRNKFTNSILENKLGEIEVLTAYMSKTIDDFKNFFSPNKQKNIFKIENAIQKALDIVIGVVHLNHIKTTINIEKDLKSYSYLEELQQVILTILNNAIEALVLMNISSGEIFIDVYKQDNNIVISIQDNALGIDVQYLDKIFEPYFTTKQKAQGTGLGLYMAKMIIENGLLGTLNVENKLNGACFTIKIPQGIE